MTDIKQIEKTIKTYFESMHESSAEKALKAFHPSAKISGYMQDGLAEMSVNDFAKLVGGNLPSPEEKGESVRLDILSIDIAGNTALARVRDDYLGMTFLDSLSLLKVDENWRIYNKLFHVEGPAG